MSNILKIAAAGATGETDENFNQTVLLLHGDGTNGAQNNTFLDSSSNGFSITRNGNTTQGTFSPFSAPDGRWGNWFNYADGSDYISFADSSAFTLGSSEFTIECWLWNGLNGQLQRFAGQIPADGATANSSWEFQKTGTGNTFKAGICSGSTTYYLESTNVIQINSWVHLALVRDGNTLRLYLNGVEEDSLDITGVTVNDSSASLSIGRLGDWVNGASALWYSYVSNFRLVVGDCVYPSGTTFTPPTSPLTAITGTGLLTCQSNRFINAVDGTAATVGGVPKVTPFSPFAPTAAYDPAVNGGSSYHDASNLSLAQALVGSTTSTFTAEGWVYMTATPSNGNNSIHGGLFHLDGEPTTGTLYLSFGPNRVQQLSMGWFDGAARQAYVNETLPLNTWIHIAVSVNSNAIKMFINGEEKTVSGTTTLTNRAGTTGKSTIGGSTSIQTKMYGYIADARVSSIARYSASFSVPTAPLTSDANTTVLSLATNAGIYDNTGKNNLETVGNAQIDTTTKQFGTGSLEFDGTGDYLISNYRNSGIGLSANEDFTLEMFFYPTNNSAVIQTLFQLDGTATRFWLRYYNSSGFGVYVIRQIGTSSAQTIVANNAPLTLNTWAHIAFSRVSGTTYLYINGTYVDSGTMADAFTDPIIRLGVGNLGSDNLYGFLDEVRYTKGVARYSGTGNFTPPTKAFPDL